MRLEPVAKTRPQHASSGARRTALEHVMLVVVEVGRVPFIEWKRLETGQRAELRRRPFPAVAELTDDSRRAAIVQMRLDGRRLPSAEIEVACLRVWRVDGGALPLGFRWQRLSSPLR